MKRSELILFLIILIIGMVFLIWASIGLIKYPGYWELVTEAVKAYWWQYAIGLTCFGYLYVRVLKKRW